MTKVNRDWAREKLSNFLTVAAVQYVPPPRGVVSSSSYRLTNPKEQVQAAAQLVEQILDRVLPGWKTADWKTGSRKPYSHYHEACIRAIAQLEGEEELLANLGEMAPQLDASSLHSWVWDGARALWSSGHYRESVVAAARSVNAQAQSKLRRRDASEAKLLSDAFSLNVAAPGHPRLRLREDDGSDTYKSIHEGAGNFARGVFSALRNPASHDELDELPETLALEQLAAFSVLARWVDEATVEF